MRAGELPRRVEGGEGRVDGALVGRSVKVMNAYDQVAIPARREVGKHVLDEYFGGDARAVKAKSPKKAKSFGALCEQAEDDTDWDAAKIREAVVAEVVARSLKATVASELRWTFLLLLYRVDALKVRRELAQKIVDGVLYGRVAKAAILAAAAPRGGGPTPRPGVERFFGRLKALIERFKADHSFDAGALRAVPDETKQEAIEEGEAAIEWLSELVAKIKKY